jgi:hypothetical protein
MDQNLKEKILEVLTSKTSKTFYWQTANGFAFLLIGVITVIQPDIVDPKLLLIASATLAGLNALTKHINKKYLS